MTTHKSPERKALQAAINAHANAVEQVERAEDMLAKAQDLLCSLDDQAAEYESLDSDIAHAKATALKLCLASGETHLPDVSHPEFAAKRIARDSIVYCAAHCA